MDLNLHDTVRPAIAFGEEMVKNQSGSMVNFFSVSADRSQTIIGETPFARFGASSDLHGTIHHLISVASAFVTGSVIPEGGGFCAFSGV